MDNLRVHHYQRRPAASQFSVERYFETVRSALAAEPVVIVKVLVPFRSRGLFRRLANVAFAMGKQGDVNHVTGDVNYVTLGLRSSRTVLSILDCQILERLTGWKRWIVRTFWFALPARRVRRITVISEATKETLLKEVSLDPERIQVIPVAVSSEFQPSPQTFNAAKPRILQIGTKANKNVRRLVESLEGVSCVLDIVGPIDPVLKGILERSHVEYENSVRLSDQQIVEKYQQCDMVAFVSTYEGFGMPIVEAQCVERPVVTSNCSSMPEVAGAGACLVDPFDTDSIRSGILRVIGDAGYRRQLIENGRENRKRFQPERIAAQFLDLYRQIARD